MMNRLDLASGDILSENVERIGKLFPDVVTEAHDETTGELRKMVDFDLLRQHLSDSLIEGDRERFRLDWPGKKASILKANTPIAKTLRPVREDSEEFDTTQNVFIEGDNFEVLKVLQESYLNSIKMIYIDPPYNTGKDFIYKDKFSIDKDDYEEEIGVRDDQSGGKLVKNTETNGRYHSDWLSMMQERLIVARDLLTSDGAIFISIDDNEQAHLRGLCDEIFGAENYIAVLPTVMNFKGNNDQFGFAGTHEYTIVYAKDIASLEGLNGVPLTEEDIAEYKWTDEVGKYKKGATLMRTGEAGVREQRPKGYYPIYVSRDLSAASVEQMSSDDIVVYPQTKDGIEMSWRRSKEKLAETIKEFIIVGDAESVAFYKKQRLEVDLVTGKKPKSLFYKPEYSSGNGTSATKELFEGKRLFDNPKPVTLIKDLVRIGANKDSIVLDFFSGSSTTAHAVMELNAEDGGNRRHIQVQLAEATKEKSRAYKAGYKTISELSRERIRRAAKKVREVYAEEISKRTSPLDTGFRAYRLSSSNFIDTAQHPSATTQTNLLGSTDNIKQDRTAEDLLTEVILDLGLTLDLPIEQRDIAGHNVYFVDNTSLVACFDDVVSLHIVDGIAAEKPLRVVFKDSSFKNDETRINVDIRLKQLSPDTTVQVV